MATGAILGGVGAGLNAVQGIASSQQAKSAGKQAAQKLDQQQEFMTNILLGNPVTDEAGILTGGREGGIWGQADDWMSRGINYAYNAADMNMERMGALDRDIRGINPTYDFNQFQFSDVPGVSASSVAEYRASAAPTVGGWQIEDAPEFTNFNPADIDYEFGGVDTGTSFNFAPGTDLMDQAMAAFRTQEAGVRANALDQMASSGAADMGALNAALAGRGVGRGSGVSAGAVADLVGQQGAQRAALERDLATLGSQTALGAAQFDVTRQLQQDEMQSGYNLGERKFLTDAQLVQQDMEARHALGKGELMQGMDQLNLDAWKTAQTLTSQYDLGIDELRSRNWGTAETINADAAMRARVANAANALQASMANAENMLTSQKMQSDYSLDFQNMESKYGISQGELAQRGLLGIGELYNRGASNQIQAGTGAGQIGAGLAGSVLSSLLGMQGMQMDGVAAAGRGAGANPIGSGFLDLAGILDSLPQGGNTTLGTGNDFTFRDRPASYWTSGRGNR